MVAQEPFVIVPNRLRSGDRVRLVSPASTPERDDVKRMVANLERLGLRPEVGDHVLDRLGYLAGADEDRLSDINGALRDPDIRGIIATRGGKGAYRIADRLDFGAARRDPKLIIGFSEITVLHLAMLKYVGLVGLHGAAWVTELHGPVSAASFERTAFTTDEVVVHRQSHEPTSALSTTGHATGRLIGGNQDMLAISSGWAQPSLEGAIVLLEAVNLRLGHIDRQLTMLTNSGALDGIAGIAIGQYTQCGTDTTTQGDWSELDVLRDRLTRLGVPILGGLPIGHGENAEAVPIGTLASIDVESGTLRVAAAVQ